MRWIIVGLTALWGLLTAFAYVVILPDRTRDEGLALAMMEVGAATPPDLLPASLRPLADCPELKGLDPGAIGRWTPEERRRRVASFMEWYDGPGREAGLPDLASAPVLVWSTDDNPARRTQNHLFRVWHLRTFGEPCDIQTDPSNRDITKTIVQCVAGAGPDVIEAYGPAELSQFVQAGVALDVTERAGREGFGVERVFPAAVSSMALEGRQYAFPCNVGYTVLFYHRDLFEEAGVTEPSGYAAGWTVEQLISDAERLMAADPSGRRYGVMGLGAWTMALASGSTFFNEPGTASFYNNPRTVAALRAYQDLMYAQRVMPTPAEAASMASSGGANMNAGAEAASASSLFAAKLTAMVSEGRWSYVSFAQRNRDRAIVPAMQRRLGELDAGGAERTPGERRLLQEATASLLEDVLLPLTPEQFAAMEACLTPEDRTRLVRLGVAHIPTVGGTPWYEAAARVAIVNRAGPRSEHATRFLRFLASEEYNEQINQTFDSICAVPEFCLDEDGISGPPAPLPGLEAFDSRVFAEAMREYAHEWELSPFIGRGRLGTLVGPVLEQLTNNVIGPAEAARVIEDRINEQIRANILRDEALRAEWERRAGRAFDPDRPLREQAGDSPQRTQRTQRRDAAESGLNPPVRRPSRALCINPPSMPSSALSASSAVNSSPGAVG
ncbi:MAG TPA: hypothetical protein DEB06_08350 [Phycisphaerales bacterium]|nr:hypothetical protein [Phycisphaerales bacterium]